MTGTPTVQVAMAHHLYHNRAARYENSWHPDYTKRLMTLVRIEPGERVLIPACGTGLEAIAAAAKVGDTGTVIGVDATQTMLDVARSKQGADSALGRRLKFAHHDVTDLTNCSAVEKKSFDLIICSNAFVLFGNPATVVQHWRTYLRDGGRMVIDIIHENAFRGGLIMEKVAKRLNMTCASNREWVKSENSFRDILEGHGFVVESIQVLEMQSGINTTNLDISQAGEEFDSMWQTVFASGPTKDQIQSKARLLFQEEWEAAATDGKIEQSHLLYVYAARKA